MPKRTQCGDWAEFVMSVYAQSMMTLALLTVAADGTTKVEPEANNRCVYSSNVGNTMRIAHSTTRFRFAASLTSRLKNKDVSIS